jgi:hypothetical protein
MAASALHSQLLEDGINLHVGVYQGVFAGNELFNSRGTIAPSFYRGLTRNQGVYLKQTMRLTPQFSAGFKLSALNSYRWESADYNHFTGSKSQLITLQPTFILHNPFNRSGVFNRLMIYSSIAPVVGISKVRFENLIYLIEGSNMNTYLLNSTDPVAGLEVGAGASYALNNQWGVFFDVAFQHAYVSVPYFIDHSYSLLSAGLGVRFSLSKNKRFNY